jgi:putative SOS response-associated peptidase YedK
MCGRYAFWSVDSLSERYTAVNKFSFEPSYNIAPGNLSPVITRNSPNKIVLMKWGLIPFWAKDPRIGYKMINARAEGIENKPAFRKPVRASRCLIPLNGFYEWKRLNLEGKEEKIPWFFGLPDKKIFSLAGIYDTWKDAEGKQILSYVIITTKANGLMSKVHDRMPVILNQPDEDKWLDKDTPVDNLLTLLVPWKGKLEAYPVSSHVNSPEHDDESLIKKL